MKNLRYYRNCDEISIYSFNKISSEGDLRHMVFDWDEYSEVKINEELAEQNWKEIFDEYCKLTDDNKIIMFYDVHQDLMKMKAKKYTILKLLEVFTTVFEKDHQDQFLQLFKDFGYPMDLSKGINEEIDRIQKRMIFFQNAINIKQKEFDSLKGGEGGEEMPFMQQVVQIEKATGRDNIDIRKTSAKKWIYILKSINDGRE
jgi:hypothetical protein